MTEEQSDRYREAHNPSPEYLRELTEPMGWFRRFAWKRRCGWDEAHPHLFDSVWDDTHGRWKWWEIENCHRYVCRVCNLHTDHDGYMRDCFYVVVGHKGTAPVRPPRTEEERESDRKFIAALRAHHATGDVTE